MKLVKVIPPWLCQTIFVDYKVDVEDGKLVNMNSSDVNIFYLLIFMTSKGYHQTKSLKQYYPFKELLSYLTKKMSTDSLVKSLEKLNNITIHSNLLQGYDDKKIKTFIPFQIKITKNIHNQNNGFEIILDEKFIKSFENPNPIFVLSYEYLTKLKSTQSKLLYLLLGDSLGIYKDKTRNVDIDMLKALLNRDVEFDNDEFAKNLKQAKNQISETDIAVSYTPKKSYVKDENNKVDNVLVEYHFEIQRTKKKPWYTKESKNNEVYVNEEYEVEDEDIDTSEESKNEETNKPFDINEIIENIIDFEIEIYQKSSQPINSMGGLRASIKKKYSSKEQKSSIQKIHLWLEAEKKKLEATDNINPSQGNILSIFDYFNHSAYTINNKYILCDHKGNEKKKTQVETYEFLNNLETTQKVSISNNQETFCKVSRLSVGKFYN